jgi:hypothetical protein
LPNVTLFCIYNVAHDLTVKALEDCCREVRFGDVKLFTDVVPNTLPPNHPWLVMKKFADHGEMCRFHHYEFPKYIETSHVLSFQWDGFIINPSVWSDGFLEYDYVGAPWWYADRNVGNGGFCLRSKNIIDFLAANEADFPHPEDHWLCREYRPRLPQFKWAPEEIAARFSVESVPVKEKTFGFHSAFNFPEVLSRDDLAYRVKLCDDDPYVRGTHGYTRLKDRVKQLRIF